MSSFDSNSRRIWAAVVLASLAAAPAIAAEPAPPEVAAIHAEVSITMT